MRRISYWALSTLTVLVLAFGYRTSTSGPLATTGNVVAQSTFSGSLPTAGAGSPGDDPDAAPTRTPGTKASRRPTHAHRRPTHSPTSSPSSTATPSASPTRASAKSPASSTSKPTKSASATARPTPKPTPKPAPKPTPKPTPTPTKTPTKTPTPTARTLTGRSVSTRWGPVQVQIKVNGTTITSVSVLQYPKANQRDIDINNRALPILINETLSAQSAHIDMVSGATYTSNGYLQSLQSALDQL